MIRSNNPALKAKQAASLAAGGRFRQARLLPNPELEFVSEKMPPEKVGSLAKAENTLWLKQEIITGGKRKAGVASARKEVEIAEQEYALAEREILTEGKKAYFALLAAQERVAATSRIRDIVQRNADATRKRVEAGDASPVESVRAQVTVARAEVALREAERERENTKKDLLRLLGMPDASLNRIGQEGDLLQIAPALSHETDYLPALESHPARRTLQLAEELAGRQLDQARRERWPNLEVGLAIGSDPGEETDNRVETAGLAVGLPLPVFDRNQGAIAEASANRTRAQQEARAGLDQLVTQLRQALQSYATAQQQASDYSVRIVPRARQALELVTKAYQSGAVSQLEVLEAQQTLAEAELEYVDVLGTLWEGMAEVEGLTGEKLRK
ncbi:MAG: TolC family protein [Planctomycetes bacterium]|nr:TolC family protein [Planctomycetota bacterium]